MEREPSPKSCAEYATRTVTGEYKYPEWQLNFICKQSAKHRPSWGPISDEKEKRGIMLKASHLCACLELERRDRYARGVGKKPKVAKKVRRSGVQVYRESLSAEYKRLRSMPKSKLAELAKEYSDERKAHPKLTNAVILQIAKDHLAYKARPRKRWKRRSAT
jgi:hypothetical protein